MAESTNESNEFKEEIHFDFLSMQHTCRRCGKTYADVRELRKHIRIHVSKKKAQCPTCMKFFRTQASLNKHISEHVLGKVFTCEWCNKKFSQTSSLREHYRVHTGEKPFICEICNQGFTTSSNMKRHKRTHTGLRPYACIGCKRTFSQSTALQRHLDLVCKTPHDCPICFETFPNNKYYEAHMVIHKEFYDPLKKNKSLSVRQLRIMKLKDSKPVTALKEGLNKSPAKEIEKLFIKSQRRNINGLVVKKNSKQKIKIEVKKEIEEEVDIETVDSPVAKENDSKSLKLNIRNLLSAPMETLESSTYEQVLQETLKGRSNENEHGDDVNDQSDAQNQKSPFKLQDVKLERLAQQMKAIVPPRSSLSPTPSMASSSTLSEESDSENSVVFMDSSDDEIENVNDEFFEDMGIMTSLNVVGLSKPLDMVLKPEIFKPSPEMSEVEVCWRDRNVQDWKIVDCSEATVEYLL